MMFRKTVVVRTLPEYAPPPRPENYDGIKSVVNRVENLTRTAAAIEKFLVERSEKRIVVCERQHVSFYGSNPEATLLGEIAQDFAELLKAYAFEKRQEADALIKSLEGVKP